MTERVRLSSDAMGDMWLDLETGRIETTPTGSAETSRAEADTTEMVQSDSVRPRHLRGRLAGTNVGGPHDTWYILTIPE